MPGGGFAIACSRGERHKLGKCRVCWHRQATLLCDGPSATARGKTCDTPLCRSCAKPGGPNVDYCPDHDAPEKRRLAL
jgi:hypothetical protein